MPWPGFSRRGMHLRRICPAGAVSLAAHEPAVDHRIAPPIQDSVADHEALVPVRPAVVVGIVIRCVIKADRERPCESVTMEEEAPIVSKPTMEEERAADEGP